MDAMRLIVASRRALARGAGAPELMTEVWQAQALAQAIGSRLAVSGPPELRGEALGLTELAGRGCGVLGTPDLDPGALRAAQLTQQIAHGARHRAGRSGSKDPHDADGKDDGPGHEHAAPC